MRHDGTTYIVGCVEVSALKVLMKNSITPVEENRYI